MNARQITGNMGYCGLICNLCHLAKDCSGCKSENNTCARYLSESGCFQYNCCKERNLNGCWECEDFSCGKDMFSESHDIRLTAFVRFIKDEGIETFAECIIKNEANGIKYGHQKDYDGLDTDEDVLTLLRSGIRKEKKYD